MKHATAQSTAKAPGHRQPARSVTTATASGSTGLPDGWAATGSAQVDAETRDAQIHRLAYERYLGNGCVDGHALDDWLAAEAAVGALGLGGDGAAAERQHGA